VWAIVSVRPHQHDHSAFEPSQADKPLFAVRIPVVFPCKHRLIENRFALRQVNPVLAQVELSLGGVIAHVLFIVYALNGRRNGVAEQAVGADRHASSRARRMCGISLCTRGALDTWSRGRSTAALGGKFGGGACRRSSDTPSSQRGGVGRAFAVLRKRRVVASLEVSMTQAEAPGHKALSWRHSRPILFGGIAILALVVLVRLGLMTYWSLNGTGVDGRLILFWVLALVARAMLSRFAWQISSGKHR